MPLATGVLEGVVSTVERMPVPAYALDAGGVVIAWNPLLERLTGTRAERVLGRSDGVHAALLTGSNGCLLADLVLDPARVPSEHLGAVARDGDGLSARLAAALPVAGRSLALHAAPIVSDGAVIGAVEVVLDQGAAPMVPPTVARLFQVVRHDIKNELTIVLGYIGLARDAVDDAVTCAGLDRAVDAATEIGRLIEFSRALEERGEHPPEARNLASLLRGAAATAELRGIDLKVTVPQVMVTRDPVVFDVLEQLFERLFQYSANTSPQPGTIRVAGTDGDPVVIVYEDDANRADRAMHPDRVFSRALDRGLVMTRDLLVLEGIALSVTPDPLHLELRIPRSPSG